ncbi:hypothetical protein FSP39_022879 [Pinctada imbricata]|uniref:Calponin-homology (CH) domain-containing protein n=1 Tax=Pinctada imbricata TaxID=66713 RepID=A0AA88YAI0_PINIB|nr:hypothetical protein FSP39_022879 [Pinctada imbricata]
MEFILNDYPTTLAPTSRVQWITIQKNTFTNWVNEQIKTKGVQIHDLRTDLTDGLLLVALVESLQRRRVRGSVVSQPSNQYEKLQNLNIALDAMASDNIRIVNIGSADITEGNVKLILALVWQLILRYQIGLSNIQHKAWMLVWVQAVIPECKVTNFTTDWNSGKALQENNCRNGMKIARQQFGIPLILRPEHLSSPDLDEFSFITYLSYFMKVGAPGYNATLQCIQPLVRNAPVFNFTTDWNDGRLLCELVNNLGGDFKEWRDSTVSNVQRLQDGIDRAKRLGVKPLLTAADIAEEDSEHLGVMAYASRFINIKPQAMSAFSKYEPDKVILYEEKRHTSTIPRHITSTKTMTKESTYKIMTSVDNTPMENSNKRHVVNVVTNGPINGSLSSLDDIDMDSNANLKYSLVRTPSLRRSKRESIDPSNGVKIDTYSVGVILSTTSHEMVSKDEVKVEAESPSGRIIKMTGDGYYNAQFAPDEIGVWRVTMHARGKFIDTCPVDVCDPSQVKVLGLKGGVSGRAIKFKVDCTRAGNGELEVVVKNKNNITPCFITKTETKGLYNVHFTPYSSGVYKISVSFSKAEIRDDDYLLGSDSDGMHRRALFSTSIKPEFDHFVIKSTCDWQIDYVTGGPFEVMVSDTLDISVYSMQDGTVCNRPHLIVDCTKAPDGDLEAEVTHNFQKFPAEIEKTKPDTYRVSFRPRGRGTYRIWLTYAGTVVKGSPFIQEIDELISPKATGEGLKRGAVDQPASFNVDARGFPGDLHIDIKGPHYPIRCSTRTEDDGTVTITYIPEEPGPHEIHIKLDGRPIQHSPFHPKIVDPTKIRVSGGWRPLLDENERIPLIVNKEKQIPFDASEAGPGELTAEVHGPSYKVPTAIDSRTGGKHILIFTPQEEGKHYIDVSWEGHPLPKTPYLGYATRLPEGQIPQTVFQPVIITRSPEPRQDEPDAPMIISTRSPQRVASPKITVRNIYSGPRRAPSDVSSTGRPPTSPVRISVQRAGSDIGIGTPVSGQRMYLPKRTDSQRSSTTSPSDTDKQHSPHRITIVPAQSPGSGPRSPSSNRPNSMEPDPTKVILSGKGLKEAFLDRPATFKVDGKHAEPGRPAATLKGVHNEVLVIVDKIGPEQYRCTYTPDQPGAYLLDITWNKRPLKCCPFKVNVHKPAYPHMVHVTGDPLSHGIVGRDIKLQIDPRNAGKGELTVDCMGPHGQIIPVHLADNFDGTQSVKIKPVEPGRHILNIRYGGDHVMGSPYAIDIKTQRGPNYPVKVYGPGVEDGILPDFESHFMVDARGAGAGELHVSIMGPKGAFQVEMHRTSQKDKLFHCRYNPVEPGMYTVNVLWSGNHVEGSPYKVNLATSRQQLDDMVMERRTSLSSSRHSRKPISGTEESIMY